ncbi:unnamed protein product, partial [Iphiclides podalirius]
MAFIKLLVTISLICIELAVAVTPALILTPYIEANKTEAARNLSTVDPSLFLNVTSYSGFLTVDESHGSNLFFWYFPSNNTERNRRPWIIWLQGGPGASSLAGLFDEIGPFEYNKDMGLKRREFSWYQEYSIVFIDNPVGAGFSFTNSKEGFARNMSMYSDHLYKAVVQLVGLFPELREAPLYVAGESYAGHYIPAFGQKTLEEIAKTTTGRFPYILKGLIMGNPILDRESVMNYTSVFYNWGLIDAQGAMAAAQLQEQFIQAIRSGNSSAAVVLRDDLLNKLQDIASQPEIYNALSDYGDFEGFKEYVKLDAVREALHVGNIQFTFRNSTVHTCLVEDFLARMSPIMTSVLEHFKVLVYCGQLDLTAACVPSGEWRRRSWRWAGRGRFLAAPRLPWYYGGRVAGYVKSGGGFTEALVRGAGHLAPIDKPGQVLQLVSYFIRGLDLPSPPNYEAEAPPAYAPVAPHRYDTALAVSVGFNVALALVAALLAVYAVRWRRRAADFFYSPVDDGVLTMT